MFDLIPRRRNENKMVERSEDPFDAL